MVSSDRHGIFNVSMAYPPGHSEKLPMSTNTSRNTARVLLASIAAACLWLAACNTTEGVGKDIESAGEGIKDAARDAKN